jgi:hypothetical protein
LISPDLLYDSETWVLTIREKNKLLIFQRKVLQVCKRRYNLELERIRISEDLPQKAIFIARSQGTRQQGRLKSSWVDGVNSDRSLLLQIERTVLRIMSNAKNFIDKP